MMPRKHDFFYKGGGGGAGVSVCLEDQKNRPVHINWWIPTTFPNRQKKGKISSKIREAISISR